MPPANTGPRNKDLRQLLRRLTPGVTVETTGTGHYRFLRDGEVVRTESGSPVTIPSSPRGGTERFTAVRLRRYGLID